MTENSGMHPDMGDEGRDVVEQLTDAGAGATDDTVALEAPIEEALELDEVADGDSDEAATSGASGGKGLVLALLGVAVVTAAFAASIYAARTSPAVTAATETAACTGCESAGEARYEAPTVGTAVVQGDVQTIAVDVSGGYFDPTVIELAAGVPAEITFSEGRGCLAGVIFEQFGIVQDLTDGGATVSIPPLEPGEYPFSCDMQMVYGALVVR
jgi:hypothetical protein